MNSARLLVGALLLTAAGGAAPPRPVVTVRQGATDTTPTADFQVVRLRRAPFSLVFDLPRDINDNKAHPERTAAVVVATAPKGLASIKVGLRTADSPYLMPGSGLAGVNDGVGYTSIFPDTEGCHYLWYESPRYCRTKLLGTNADGTLHLEWRIYQVMLVDGGPEIPLAQTRFAALYFAFFVDKNANGRVDAGELNKLALAFQ